MKILSIFILAILSLPLNLFSSEIDINSEELNSSTYLGLSSYHNKLLISGFNNTISGNERWFYAELFDGNDWETINFELDGDTLLPTAFSFDSEGKLWFGINNDIYMWNGSKLTNKIKVDFDGQYNKRTIKKMMFDSTDNLWFTSIITHSNENSQFYGYSQLIQYDFNKFQILDTAYAWGYSEKSILYTKNNGNVIASKSLVKEGEDNLLVYTPNLELTTYYIPSPYQLTIPNVPDRNTDIKQAFEDSKGNLWLAIKHSEPENNGILIWDKNKEWHTLKGENGYPMYYNQFKDRTPFDSVFAEAYGITEDSEGNIWICGTGGFLNTVNKDFEVGKPDTSDFFNNLTFYGTKIIADKSKPNFPHNRYDFMRNSDSLHQVLIKYMNQNYYTPKNGVSPYGWVSGLAQTDDGSIWVAIDHLGVLRYKNPNITGVETDDVANSVKLFPNPVSLSYPNIKLQLDKAENISSIKIFDLEGNTLLNRNINMVTERLDIDLNRKDFSTGTYFTAIYIDNKIIFRKFVIN